MVVTPDTAFDGEVLVEDDLITCVQASCASETGAATASVVETNGIILPGLIDTHNHILYNIFDESDWVPSQVYDNHNQWTAEAKYDALVDAKQYLNGEGGSPVNVNCEMNKYGEIKALISGTTSVSGAGNPGNKVCYRTLARTIDQSANGLCCPYESPTGCTDKIQQNVIFPTTSSANAVCANFDDGDTESYLIHLGEGVDATALAELDELYTVTDPDGCLYDPRTVIIHGTAFGSTEFATMSANGMGLVWSPKSNIFLYGGGTDLSKTTDVPAALSAGLTVSVGPDWSLGGSLNMLDEMAYADMVDNSEWSDQLSAQDLLTMATANAAELLALEDTLGRLEVGYKADLFVIRGDTSAPYDAVIGSTPLVVGLVMVNGAVLYGDTQLEPLGPPTATCEALDICGEDKFICAAISGGTSTSLWDQTLSDISTAIDTELASYDSLDLSSWDFAPIAPLLECP